MITNLDFQIRERIRRGQLTPDNARKARAIIATTGATLIQAAKAAKLLDLTTHQIRGFRHGGITYDLIKEALAA